VQLSAQHTHSLEGFYGHFPGLKVVSPATPHDVKGMMLTAIRDPNPVIFLENEILYGQSFPVPKLDDFVLPIGKAKVLREGGHVTITAFSLMVDRALKAADKLAEEGIEAEVIDLRTIRPLDTQTIVESVKKTNRIVSVEEGWPQSGMGAEIAAVMMEQAFDWLDAPVVRVHGKDVPMPYAANLERLALPQVDDVVAAAKAVCYRS
jgi:pyruvate dehydrogenase E1 component beta subunit